MSQEHNVYLRDLPDGRVELVVDVGLYDERRRVTIGTYKTRRLAERVADAWIHMANNRRWAGTWDHEGSQEYADFKVSSAARLAKIEVEYQQAVADILAGRRTAKEKYDALIRREHKARMNQ